MLQNDPPFHSDADPDPASQNDADPYGRIRIHNTVQKPLPDAELIKNRIKNLFRKKSTHEGFPVIP